MTGPGGPYALTQTTPLTGLTPGTYAVTGTIVGSASNNVYVPVVTDSPAVVSQNGGAAAVVTYKKLVANWKSLGPSKIGGSALPSVGKLQSFAVSNSNPSLMYASGSTQYGTPYTETGVYKSTNGGSTWSQKNNGLTDPTVNALWLDQSKTGTVLAGTNSGIFRTTNGGTSWGMAPGGNFSSVMAFSESNGTLYAATLGGIATSTDNGETWSDPPTYPTTSGVQAIAQSGGYTYAGLLDGNVLVQSGPSAPWVLTYPPVTNASVMSVAVNPTTPLAAFVVEWMWYQSPDVYMTTDGGAEWTSLSGTLYCPVGPFVGQQAQALAFESASGNLYAGCDEYSDGTEPPLFLSSNGGATWSPVSIPAAWDIRLIIPDAEGVVGNMIVGSDQGLYLTSNGGTSWQDLNGNITSSILFAVGVSGATILTTAQDYGPITSTDGGTSWTSNIVGSEGGVIAVNPANPAYVYIFFSGNPGSLWYSEDGGQTFTPSSSLSASPGGSDSLTFDPNNASILYAAANSGFYQSTDWGVDWMPLSWPFGPTASTPTYIQAVGVSPDPSPIPYLVGVCNIQGTGCNTYTSGAVWYFDTATDQWNLSSLPAGTCGLPESILFDPENPQIVLVAMSVAASCGGVLRSVDGGVTFSSPAGNSALTQRSVGCNSIINIPTLRRWPVGCGGGGNTQRRVPLDRLRSELANHSRKHRASLGYRRDVVWRLPVRIDVWGRGAPFALCVLAGACCRHTVFQ